MTKTAKERVLEADFSKIEERIIARYWGDTPLEPSEIYTRVRNLHRAMMDTKPLKKTKPE
jgi:hypothetical protein